MKIYLILILFLASCASVSEEKDVQPKVAVDNPVFFNYLKKHYTYIINENSLDASDADNLAVLDIDKQGSNLIKGEIDLSPFQNLREFTISNSQIMRVKNIPKTIEVLICNNNQIDSLDISHLTGLKRLECANNQIRHLDFSKNSSLEVVIYTNNPIKNQLDSLPKGLKVWKCSNTNLKISDNLAENISFHQELSIWECDSNQLIALPEKLPAKLNYLSCENNLLTAIDNIPPRLDSLNCSHNQISVLGNMPHTLQVLNCAYNQLTTFPEFEVMVRDDDGRQYNSLQYLNCSHNQIDSISKLPNANKLQNLDCSYNQIRNLPVIVLKNLTILDCSYNQISSLPEYLPLSLSHFKANNNQISRLDYLPCQIKNINLDSNQLAHIGDLPPSVVQFSFNHNPIYNEQKLLELGWSKNANNQWDKPRKGYDCVLNYIIKANCSDCAKGYQLTPAAYQLEKLDLSLAHNLISEEIGSNFLDLSAFNNLRVLNAHGVHWRIDKLILPKSLRIVDASGLDTIEGLGENLLYLKTDVQVDWAKVSRLKWLIIGSGKSHKDTIYTLPKSLKRLEIYEKDIHISDTISWSNMLTYVHLESHPPLSLFNSLPADIKYLHIRNFQGQELPPIINQLKKLTYFGCDYCNKLVNINNLPPNLDTLVLHSSLSNTNTITQLNFNKKLKYANLSFSNFKKLTSVKGLGLKKLRLRYSGMPKLPNFNTPNLTELDISYSNFDEIPSNWPASVRELDISRLLMEENTSRFDWTKLPCSYWKGLKVVKLEPQEYEELKESIACARSKGTRFIYW